ncbi:MAG: nucleoside deaminase [Verrucomicrobia bacterium]|nr:nucleoside deaminase [Verrucomicrobiota bacterium]
MQPSSLTITLPAWLQDVVRAQAGHALLTADDRMAFAIALARRNVEAGTGGPFGAIVVERDSGKLVSAGVNLVVPAACSVAHAEMVAVMAAQAVRGDYDLGRADQPPTELVTSTEPCAMCLGAVPWSGVRGLICGARKADAEAIGFDEGDKPEAWVAQLEKRGIVVTRDICREAAAQVLRDYAARGGETYNSRTS